MRRIYFDNSSTSFPKAPGVGRAMAEFLETSGVNIGRGAYRQAYAASERVFAIREQLARRFGADRPEQVIFTAGATDALNRIILGLLRPGDHVVGSSLEHNAVARPLEAAKQRGVAVSIAEAQSDGELTAEAVVDRLRPETRAIVLFHGSNVCGSVSPIAEITRLCREQYAGEDAPYAILDAAQTAGSIALTLKQTGADAIVFSGHKAFMGPQGVGGFVLNDRLADELVPIVCGGTGSAADSLAMPDFLPDRFEAGTLNLPGIIGLGAALRFIDDVGESLLRESAARLTHRLMRELRTLPGVRLIGYPESADPLRRCPVLAVHFEDRDQAEITWRLDEEYGIMTRCGLHCAPLAHRTLGTFPEGTVRFSFGAWNTEAELEYTLQALKIILR